jgi:pimeloyl-ACP methyl ester carboxylesterase
MADGDDPTAHGLDEVIDSVVSLVNREDLSDVVLVGHSWAGYVVTGAVPHLGSRVGKLVYWSAFVPADGASLVDEIPAEEKELLAELAQASGNNSIVLPLEFWQEAFIQDATEEVQRLTHALLVPHPMQYSTTPVSAIDVAKLGIPTTYLLGDADLTMPPGDVGWRGHAARLGVAPTMIRGSHEIFFTEPQVLAEALLAI